MTLAKIAEHWGVSRPRVSQLVKEGCPTRSLTAADRWREARGLRRAPTNGATCKFAVVKLGRGRRLRRPVQPSHTGNTLEDLLNDATYMNKQAFTHLEEARLEGNDNRIALYMRVYLASLHMRLKAEKLAREEMERRRVLVNMEEARAVCRRCLDAVAKRIRRLPQEVGPQINPQQPVLAYEILQRAVNEVLVAGQDAIRGLEKPEKR